METPSDRMHVIYRWKSIYEFSPELVKELIHQVRVKGVKVEFDAAGQAFTLDGERGDTKNVLDALQRAIKKAVKASEVEGRKPGYIPLVRRSRLTEFNSFPIVWAENVPKESGISDIDSMKDTHTEFKLIKIWSPNAGSDFAKILHPEEAEADIPTMISGVCDCSLEVDLFQRRLKIHANDSAIIERVIRKLNKIEEIYKAFLSAKTAHLVYVDDKAEFQLKLVSLKSQLRTIGKTTLLGGKNEKYYQDRKLVHSLRILRTAAGSTKAAVVPMEINEIPGNRQDEGPRAWKDYVFKGFGIRRPPVPASAKGKSKSMQAHAEQLSRALEPWASSTWEPRNTDEFDLFDSGPQPTFVDMEDESTDFLSGPRPNFGGQEEVAASSYIASKRRLKVFGDSGSSSTVANPSTDIHYPEFQGSTSGTPGGLNPEELINFSSPPAIPQGPPQKVTRATRRLRVLDAAPVEEKQQQASEIQTRTFRNVNSQKKTPKKKEVKEYNLQEHMKYNKEKLHEVFEPAFNYARLHKGRLTLEARLGRVLYDSAPPATKCMSWDQLPAILGDRIDTMKVLFTDRITADFVDVDYVCDVKLSPRQELFSYDPESKTVWFEFLCDYRGKPCLVKIDAETKEMEVLGRLETYGTVYWNCPMRSWDSRFTMQARKILNKEEAPFQSLAESLYVTDNTRLPNITFRTEHNDLIVKKVYCKREARYLVLPSSVTGPDRNFEFCITEVMYLWIQAHASDEETYRASATDRNDMIAKERLYYTFSVVPTKAEAMLSEQATLEVGEVSRWTARDVLGSEEDSVLEAMTYVVNAVIERIDNVGYNNEGAWCQSD
ncbi:hypothetical protein BDZ91DRAFT_710645 [Kalaharituber pfeilii]|nr:hypothetical protein BDZ91DRAFT_710645 [Kalaharituber pfeilii]